MIGFAMKELNYFLAQQCLKYVKLSATVSLITEGSLSGNW